VAKNPAQAVLFLHLLTIAIAGCGGNKASKIADFAGDWKSTEGENPSLSLDADGKGVLSITFSDAGGGRGGLSMSRTEVKQHEGKFFIDTSITGETGSSQEYRFELFLSDSQTLKLKLVDSSDNREFTLTKK
jgi:hypothetical protein